MTARVVRIVTAVVIVAGLMATAAPAHADPCDVRVKDVVVIDLINCG